MGLVLFVDMDYFFAACEELRHPELKAKPFVVGTATIARRERGVVQTCNYEARKFGIHSAMPTSQALRLKPDLVYLESDEDYYSAMSEKVMALLKGSGFKAEVISIDEAALDMGDISYEEAERLGKEVKARIKNRIGLPCTMGISIGKIYAKMVCDDSKPNGLGVLKEEGVRGFLEDRDVDRLLGVGRKTEEKLKDMGITKIGQLAKADPNVLIDRFGSFGKELFLLANGMDNSRIVESYGVMSVGRERTLEKETGNIGDIEKMMDVLSGEVIDDLKKKGMWFKGISVKARYADFTERIKNKKLNNYTDSIDMLRGTAMQLLKELISGKSIRKVGVRAYMLDLRKGQRSIF